MTMNSILSLLIINNYQLNHREIHSIVVLVIVMRRLEAEGESVQRERMSLKTTVTSMQTMTTARISSTAMATARTICPFHRATITAAHSNDDE
jgi:hypothetical protein